MFFRYNSIFSLKLKQHAIFSTYITIGQLQVFIQQISVSLTINENADTGVNGSQRAIHSKKAI